MISPMLFSRPGTGNRTGKKMDRNFSETEESGMGISESGRMVPRNVGKSRHVFVMEKRF